MKLVRPLLIGLALVVVSVALVLAIAFSSGFQTWAARKALATQPDLQGTIGSVSAGLHRVEVKDARLVHQGAVLTLPALEAELSLLSAGLHGQVSLTKILAKGWVLDLTNAEPSLKKAAFAPQVRPARLREFSLVSSAIAAEPPAAQVFRGVFAQLQLPVDLTLDGVDLEGEVIVAPVPGKPAARVKVKIRGGGLAAGREGSFTFDCTTAAGAGVAPISAQELHGTLGAAMDTPRSFTRLSVKTEASASGTQFPRGVKVNVELIAARDNTGESYVMSLAGEGKQLAGVNAGFPGGATGTAGTGKLSGTWKINLRDSDLVPFALGVPLPTFEVAGDGTFAADAAFSEIHTSGKLHATADKLAALQPELGAIGPVRMDAAFDLAQRGDTLRIERLTVDLAGAKPVASVRALQTFDFNPKTAELTADPARDLLGITLEGMPLAWLQSFLPDFQMSGSDLRGEFVATAGGGGLALRPKTPLTITNLSIAQKDKPLIQAVDVSLSVAADYTPQGWQVVLAPFSLKSGAATLLTLEAKAGQLMGKDRPIKATGKLAMDVPAMLAQPAAAGVAQLTAGEASVNFSASFGAKQEIQAQLVIANLAGDPKLIAEKLPGITADFRVDREANGKITLGIPLLVERDGRKSDLNVAGTVVPETSGLVLDAHMTSTLLVIDDVQILAAPFASSAPKSTTPGKTPPRDTAPLWAGISGKLTLALKKIVYSDTFEVADVGGTLRLDAGAVKWEGIRAGVGNEGELKGEGGVTFDAAANDPYSLTANVAVNNFDSGPLFRALNPAKPPTIEGKFNLQSKLAGTGQTIGHLAEQARGTFDVSSKGGVFRGLAAVVPSDKLESAQSALAIVSGFLGGSTAKVVGVAGEILKIISEISFDQLSVTAERDDALNFVLKDFSLIAPDVRLGGAGQIIYAPGKKLLEQTLDMQLSLGTRGRLGELMAQAKLLKPETDNLGYTAFSAPIKIGGTLENTDTSDLQRKLLNLALEKSGLGGAWEKLMGGGK